MLQSYMGQFALGASPDFVVCVCASVSRGKVVLVAVYVSTRVDKSFPSLCVYNSFNNNNDGKIDQNQ